jgi:undecaprenyl-diphosphatase
MKHLPETDVQAWDNAGLMRFYGASFLGYSMIEFLSSLPLLVKAAILGVVEGLTEFLPISSTGHLILAGSLLGWHDEKAKVFEIVIQTGAMLAVLWYFRLKILKVLTGLFSDPTSQRFALNVLIAFLPAAVLGLAFGKYVKAFLFKPVPVAIAFIVGGLIILWVETRPSAKRKPRIQAMEEMTHLDALKLGFAQALALIPGTSRSGATIIGGMLFGLSRKAATEFSFFLAMPTLIGAGAYDAYKNRALLSLSDWPIFAVGTIISFISALACVHWLIRFVATRDFTPFAWYRIVFGLIVLLTAYTGLVTWAV